MKIRCPKCNTAYEVPDDKIPEKGVLATCKVCKSSFTVSKLIESKTENTAPGKTKNIVVCPKCSCEQEKTDVCRRCGITISKYGFDKKFDNKESSSNESTDTKSRKQKFGISNRKIIIILGILIGIISSFMVGRYTAERPQRITVAYESSDDVKEELDRSFGWGKAVDNIDVEAVDIKRGVYIDEYSDYKFPTPAVSLSIKNCGKKDLESFSLTYGFSDIDNKRDLGHYGTASGAIKSGWTSDRELFKLDAQTYLNIIGNKPIDVRIHFIVGTWTRKNRWITFYETDFSPNELKDLPRL